MNKIRVFETFAGIGAQAKAFKNSKLKYEVVAISEWYINALLAYDAIHGQDKKIIIPSYSEQMKYLNKLTFSKDAMTPCKDLKKFSKKEIEKLYIANKRSNNLGSITEINSADIPDHDLLTYSFPCQDLSTGGKTLGMKKGSGTRSGLLWEIERILKGLQKEGRLPKYLMMENVKAILAPSNEKDFNLWLSFLHDELHYENHIMTLSGIDFNVPQDRERVIVVSFLCDKKDFDINNQKQPCSKQRIKKYLRLDYSNNQYRMEADEAQLNRTPSREKMWEINKKNLNDLTFFNTITTNLDRQNNAGMLEYSGAKGDSYRLLTAREAFLLMGFSEKDYEKVRSLGFSYRQLIKLAGNSIIVDVLMAVFNEMFKGEK